MRRRRRCALGVLPGQYIDEDARRHARSCLGPAVQLERADPDVDHAALTVAWKVEMVEAAPEDGLGFDRAVFSKRSATRCLACGAAVDQLVKAEGVGKRMGSCLSGPF